MSTDTPSGLSEGERTGPATCAKCGHLLEHHDAEGCLARGEGNRTCDCTVPCHPASAFHQFVTNPTRTWECQCGRERADAVLMCIPRAPEEAAVPTTFSAEGFHDFRAEREERESPAAPAVAVPGEAKGEK